MKKIIKKIKDNVEKKKIEKIRKEFYEALDSIK